MDGERKLRTRERNAFRSLINEVGLDPADFVWAGRRVGTFGNPPIESLEHPATGSYFALGVGSDGTFYYGERDPGSDAQVSRLGGLSWSDALMQLRLWLRSVQQEEEPDRWADVDETREQLTTALGGGAALETPVSVGEREAIAEHLAWIREAITTSHELSTEQLELLDARLAELEAASRRLTRKDFLNYAIGAVLTLALELALTSTTGNELLRGTIGFLTNLFGGLSELPPGPG